MEEFSMEDDGLGCKKRASISAQRLARRQSARALLFGDDDDDVQGGNGGDFEDLLRRLRVAHHRETTLLRDALDDAKSLVEMLRLDRPDPLDMILPRSSVRSTASTIGSPKARLEHEHAPPDAKKVRPISPSVEQAAGQKQKQAAKRQEPPSRPTSGTRAQRDDAGDAAADAPAKPSPKARSQQLSPGGGRSIYRHATPAVRATSAEANADGAAGDSGEEDESIIAQAAKAAKAAQGKSDIKAEPAASAKDDELSASEMCSVSSCKSDLSFTDERRSSAAPAPPAPPASGPGMTIRVRKNSLDRPRKPPQDDAPELPGAECRAIVLSDLTMVSADSHEVTSPRLSADFAATASTFGVVPNGSDDGRTAEATGPSAKLPRSQSQAELAAQRQRAMPRIAGLKREGGSILKKSGTSEFVEKMPKDSVKSKHCRVHSVMFENEVLQEESEDAKPPVRISTLTVRNHWEPGEHEVEPRNNERIRAKSIWVKNNNELSSDCKSIKESGEDKKSLVLQIYRRLIVHPNSTLNFYFDILCLTCIGYDWVVVPIRVFGAGTGDTVPLAMKACGWGTTIFWQIDLIRQCLRGYYVDGEVMMDHRKIFTRYARSWGPLDVAIIITDWVMLALENTRGPANVPIFFRIARLLRAIKSGKLLKMVEDRIQAETLAVMWITCKLFITILFVNHLSACMWYSIGLQGRDSNHSNWVDTFLSNHEFGQTGIYQYMTSYHWVLTQFTPASIEVQPTNSVERVFAIFMLLFALVTVSTFVSGITSAVMQLRQLSSAKSKKFWQLRKYLSQSGVSTQLSVRITNYCEHAWRSRGRTIQEKDVDLLMLVSVSLRAELKAALFAPKLINHAFFMLLQTTVPATLRSMCYTAIAALDLGPSDHLFCVGEAASGLYIAWRGQLNYVWWSSAQPESLTHWTAVSESALWTIWTHRGDLTSKQDSSVIAIEADNFGKVININADARREAVYYARGFMHGLNREPEDRLNDLYTSPIIEGLWFRLLNDFQVTRRTLHSSRRPDGTSLIVQPRDIYEQAGIWTQMFRRRVRKFLGRKSEEDSDDEGDTE